MASALDELLEDFTEAGQSTWTPSDDQWASFRHGLFGNTGDRAQAAYSWVRNLRIPSLRRARDLSEQNEAALKTQARVITNRATAEVDQAVAFELERLASDRSRDADQWCQLKGALDREIRNREAQESAQKARARASEILVELGLVER
jgi:hypothetical protein